MARNLDHALTPTDDLGVGGNTARPAISADLYSPTDEEEQQQQNSDIIEGSLDTLLIAQSLVASGTRGLSIARAAAIGPRSNLRHRHRPWPCSSQASLLPHLGELKQK